MHVSHTLSHTPARAFWSTQVSTFVVITAIAVGCYVLFLPFVKDRAAFIVLVTLYTTLLVAVGTRSGDMGARGEEGGKAGK
jgi:hypothetical protein